MSRNKRKVDSAEPKAESAESTIEKRLKVELTNTIDSRFLRIDEALFAETGYQLAFQSIADKLINTYEFVVNQQHIFRLCELEFYFYQHTRHLDTFAHRHPEQTDPAKWYFHRQGTSATAAYKGGTYKGLDVTFSSASDESFGGILIRSIENKQTGQIFEGSCRVVDALLNLCNTQSIKELVEMKMNKNLRVFDDDDGNKILVLRPVKIAESSTIPTQTLIASPRVGLTLKVASLDRERFLFRSYRFTPADYYPSKMKMTIVLALAANKYFASLTNNEQPPRQFTDFAQELSVQTNTRLPNVLSYLADLQRGYDAFDKENPSPLVAFHKKAFSSSDLARAYGTWLRVFRSN